MFRIAHKLWVDERETIHTARHLGEINMHSKFCQELKECINKNESQARKVPFGKKADYDFKGSLVEETIPSDSKKWNHWVGNRNSGMDALVQANDIDRTQHRKQQKKKNLEK